MLLTTRGERAHVRTTFESKINWRFLVTFGDFFSTIEWIPTIFFFSSLAFPIFFRSRCVSVNEKKKRRAGAYRQDKWQRRLFAKNRTHNGRNTMGRAEEKKK